ncbi:hypothetical protein QQ045_009559 [Rhodiola kirilowii]
MGLKQVVKTTEEIIPLNSEELKIRLLDESDLLAYKYSHKYMHIGLVQIAFKPLTLEGSLESFMVALRDGRNLNWKQSLMGIVQTSLTPEGSVNLEFDNIIRPSTSSRLSESSSMRNYISPFDYKIERPLESLRASTSQIRDTERIERLIIDYNNIISGINTRDPEITESEKEFEI